MKNNIELEKLTERLKKLLNKSLPLPPIEGAFFICGIEINLENKIKNQSFTILLEDSNFYELSIEYNVTINNTLDRISQRSENLIKLELTDDAKMLHLLKAIEILESIKNKIID